MVNFRGRFLFQLKVTARDVKTPQDALAYMVECELATLSRLVTIKRTPKCELARHTAIAQRGIDWMLHFNMYVHTNSRAFDAAAAGGVQAWLDKIKHENS